MCIDAPESTTNSLSYGLIVDGAGEKNAVLSFSSGYILPFSTLLHGHLVLAFPSLLETDPQILEHGGCADEDHLGKLDHATDSGLECLRDATRLW